MSAAQRCSIWWKHRSVKQFSFVLLQNPTVVWYKQLASPQSSSRFCLADVQERGTRCYFHVQSGFANCIIRSLWYPTCQNGRKHSLCMGWQAKSTWWVVSRTTLWFILINCIPVMINYHTTWAIAGAYKHTQVVGRCESCITLTTVSPYSFEVLSMPLWPPTQTTVMLFVPFSAKMPLPDYY